MPRKSLVIITLILISFFFSFCADEITSEEIPISYDRTYIAASEQRSGNVSRGLDYLITGDYVSSGIPINIFNSAFSANNANVLEREGDNATLSPEFTAIEHSNGTKVVSPNCLTCHGEYLNNEFIIGLGNTTFDYTTSMGDAFPLLDFAVTATYGPESAEWEAYRQFSKSSQAINPNIILDARGVNPADQLTAVLVAHRDPESLEWSDEPALEIPVSKIPTDVPAWWLLKYKHAMFYAGIGRGDYSKFLMASSLLTLSDTLEAKKIDSSFVDVLAWINSLEAPEYPDPIDQDLAVEGAALFNLNCASCHGNTTDGTYPNLIISTEEVGTDATLAQSYGGGIFNTFSEWYNKSWFAKGEFGGRLVTTNGYIAPPLEGVWATAPYFHNGSVPNLELLLNSTLRPDIWTREFGNSTYDLDKVGWPYEELDSKEAPQHYDTSQEGYGNQGHTFGDDLNDSERTAVIEYLKTL